MWRNSRPVRLKPEQPWECKSPHADQSGMSTGQVRRACLLNSACLRASGALQFATANSFIWGIHLARLGKSTPATRTNLKFLLVVVLVLVLEFPFRLRQRGGGRGRFPWNVNRSSAPGLGANECVPSGKWCKSTAFRHSCARSSKRAGGLIPRIALDQCRVPERYWTRVPI